MATAIQLLKLIQDRFPEADPNHELYDSGINGADAVDFLCEIVPQIIECLSSPPPRVAVVLEGGLVQAIASDRPDEVAPATFIVVDYDTKDSDEGEKLHEVTQGNGTTAQAYARFEDVSQAWIDLDALHQGLSNLERS